MTAAAGVITEVGFCGQSFKVLLPRLFTFLLLKLKALLLWLTDTSEVYIICTTAYMFSVLEMD